MVAAVAGYGLLMLFLLLFVLSFCCCCSSYKNLTFKHNVRASKNVYCGAETKNARARLYTLYSLTRRLKTYIFKFHLYELWIGATGIYKRNLIHIDLMYKQQHIEVNMSYIEYVWYIYRYSSTTVFAIRRPESVWSIWKQF